MPPTAVHSPLAASASSELSTSDRSLVTLASRGDQRAFELLFRRHRPAVHAYAARMLQDHEAAEDVVQEVFFSAMRAMRRGTEPTHVRAWLQEIARHACVDHWRGSERRREVSYDAPDSLSGKDARQMAISGDTAMRGVTDRESLACLRSAFEDLPPLQHSVLVQRELEGRSPHEIAERLGITPTAVEGQLARGRRSLQLSFRELQSGERCAATRDLCDASLDRALGVRERTKLRVHLRTCSSCRRHARAVGVEPRLFDTRVLGSLGFLLPLPLLKRFPLASLFAQSESLGAAVAGKALVGAAVIAAGGGSALVMSDIGPGRGGDSAPVVRQADDPGLPGGTANAAVPIVPGPLRPSIVPASLVRDATDGGLAPRLIFASETAAGSGDDHGGERRRRDAATATSAGTTSGSASTLRRPSPVDPVAPAPLTLPRFVPSTPPRVQRLSPSAEGPEAVTPVAPIPTTPSDDDAPALISNGKQLTPLPDTKVDGETNDSPPAPAPEPVKEPEPAPRPDPVVEQPAPTPAPGDGGTTPTAPTPPAGIDGPTPGGDAGPTAAQDTAPGSEAGVAESAAPDAPAADDEG